jgi:cytochrome c oxidase cbb3-type subunit 4
MAIENVFDSASSVMTVISFITFVGIWAWAWAKRNQDSFAQAAKLPFADEEERHG